jgi:hypothetical protein
MAERRALKVAMSWARERRGVSFSSGPCCLKNGIARVPSWNYPRDMNAMETMLAAVADTFDANALGALVEMRAPEEAAERMAYLAERANEGLLTEEERHEYHSAISFGNFLGLLQTKARLKLNSAA